MPWNIGILCAGDTELEPFLSCLQNPKVTEAAMLKVYEGVLQGVRVTALYSGVCRVNAAIAAQILIDRYKVNGIINAGTAGGLDPSIRLFDTVIPSESAYHDLAADLLTDFHPWLPSVYIPSDPSFLSAAKRAAERVSHPIRFGIIVTGENFIEREEQRREILKTFRPLAVDMETAGVAHVCHVNQVPFIAIRTVTDTADHAGIGAFEENCGKASRISRDVTVRLLEVLGEENGR